MQHRILAATSQSRWHWKRYLMGSCCILFLFFLSGSQSQAASATKLPLPMPAPANILQIQLQTPHPGPVIETDNALLVSRLYNKMYRLPAYPQGRTCEEFRQGDVYSLTFNHNTYPVVHASVERNGCHGLTLSRFDTRKPDQEFWALFDQARNSGHAFGHH
jgi:hypothetical protein